VEIYVKKNRLFFHGKLGELIGWFKSMPPEKTIAELISSFLH